MVVECPHCFTRVFVKASGDCPACQKNVHEVPRENREKSSIAIDERASLPPVCCQCGLATDRYVRVKSRISLQNTAQTESGALWLAVLFSPLHIWLHIAVGLIGWFRGDFSSRISDVVTVRMPQCDNCSREGAPAPIYVSPETRQLTFVVHKQFKNLLLKPPKNASGQMESPHSA